VAGAPLAQQLTVLTGVAILITVGVYGVVAAIVKLDDGGLWLATRQGQGAPTELLRSFGRLVLAAAPWLMKALSIVGTAAMFMVGGGILIHGLPFSHDLIHSLVAATESLPWVGGILASLAPLLLDVLAGILAGALILLAMTLGGKAWTRFRG
jgi:predicted DNA repair protein MutK